MNVTGRPGDNVITDDYLCLCSLEDQMERASYVYMDLLDGNDKPVAGSTCAYNL